MLFQQHFLMSKIDTWNKNKLYKNAILYIAFAFTDDEYYFIKYTKSKLNNIKTEFISEWHTTNFVIPLNKCISVDKFIQQINKLKSDLAHVN